MRRIAVLLATGLLAAAAATPPATVGAGARTVAAGPFAVEWSADDPEEIVDISWNGSPNLTNSSPNIAYPCGGDSEFFGNSWGLEGAADWAAPVGAGTSGSWSSGGSTVVGIRSAASGCFGTSGVPVDTNYKFFANGSHVDAFSVDRRFWFGPTRFAYDFRPYVPRLYPRDSFDTVIHPDATGSALIVEDVDACEFGCLVSDWDGTWFAVHDQYAGRGMVVRHMPGPYRVGLWVDADGYSQTTASSVAFLQPEGGFYGSVMERETLCFYDSTTWTPSLTTPTGC